ncbi:AzlD domain-containing protein [Streptomyces sp. NPDC046866]|uniref:AzlD domain-containing protein n=1 Tax=Streptomyces sp. NPDC046866 TaxID=3154921 RepID=UPI003451552B
MSDTALALTIAGMAAVSFGPRLLPTLLLAAAALPAPVVAWLRQVPPAVIAALPAPARPTSACGSPCRRCCRPGTPGTST